ncbi:hypothetical protein ACLOJK_000903 [Asimina triloba]
MGLFIETSQESLLELELEGVRTNWLLLALSSILQKLFLWLQVPLAIFGAFLEFTLNFFSLNGGLFGLIIKIIKGTVVFPNKNSADYRSVIAFDDERLDLHKTCSLLSNGLPQFIPLATATCFTLLDLCMMASKVAYENEAYIKNAVTNHWQMEFVEFFKDYDTQAFIFCDRPEDANIIVVAFRGTQPFNGRDWVTDVDFSWISMGEMGRAHVGFMKALGMQDEKDYRKGWPKDYEGEKEKPLAYYAIRETLKTLLLKHPNAKIVVTGHSLGGALAAVFPAILRLHEENAVLGSLWGLITYGQPRVGDETFASYVEAVAQLNASLCFRAVYRYDAVPRVPFDGVLFQFKHFGNCIYYNGWIVHVCFIDQVMREEPNRNGLNPLYIVSKYYHALGDLIKALFLGMKEGPEFKETGFSIFIRFALLILPEIASHFPRDYVNAARLGKITLSAKEIV